MKLTTEQSKNIQILRGLAIIAVVFIHNTPIGLAQVFCRPFLNFSVGLFLFLSGMLSNASNWNPTKRIIKVLIPYVLWTLIYSIMYNITTPISIPSAFVKNVLTGKAAAVMYYIFIYCEFTLLIPFIDRLAKSKFKYCGFLIAPIEIVIMRSIPLIAGIAINKYISILMSISCLGWFTYFYLGYLVGNKLISINATATKITLLWMLSILLQILEGYYYYTLGYENCGTQLKLTSIISGALFALMAYNYVIHGAVRNIKVLELLGDNSFGIYFSHLAVMAVIEHIPVYTSYVTYPITAVITIVLTTICVLLGKRVLGKYSKYLAL
ncbi:MAG: acyltransferase [Clostridia bacterium]|nr:acyltransferase [Clostridia bacterium]